MSDDSRRRADASAPSVVRFAVVAALSAFCAGCFQPLYGNQPLPGTQGQSLRDVLSAVEVQDIAAPRGSPQERLAVEVRNALIYDLTGGSGSAPPTHRLNVRIVPQRLQVIVDLTSGRPNAENFGIDATYTLIDLATGKPVVNGTTFSRVTYDVPGSEQRFARQRALRDAEDRAAKVIAENIKNRLASFFVAGT